MKSPTNKLNITKTILLLLLSIPTINSIDQYTNQTFMFPKEISGSFGMEQASWNNIAYNKKNYGQALQAYGYGQTSISDPENPKYYLFNFLDSLIVQSGKEPYNQESFTRDILGAWIGINDTTPFEQSFTLTPKQSQYGVTIGFSQDLSNFFDMALLRNLSFNVSIPVVHIKNQLVFQGDPIILNALQGNNAMSMNLSEPWQYLILDETIQEDTKFTNVKFQFATKYQSEDDVQVATTSFAIFPCTPSVTNKVLFEPVYGYNGHIVLGSGVNFQFPLLRSIDELTRICLYFGVENKFLFGNDQQRTLELKGKPYSRYMPIYDRHTGKLIPGVNVFTKDCFVEPYNIVNFILGLRYKYKDSVSEIGYELWAKDTEKVTVNTDNAWQENRYAIANINDQGELDQSVQTANGSTINYVVPDTTNTYIKAKDLTRLTASGRAALVHRAYTSLGYGSNNTTTNVFCNLGLYIEITQNNAAMSNWGAWLKAGLTF